MRKVLLSAMAVALGMGMASASTKLVFNDVEAANINGKHVATEYKEDGSVNAYEHWQPLEDFTLNEYEFSFANPGAGQNEPAFYTAKSGSNWTVRMYQGNSMTVAAPAGVKMAKVVFGTTNGKETYSCKVDAGTTAFSYTSSTKQTLTWTASEPVTQFTITSDGTIRFENAEIYVEGEDLGGDTPATPGEGLYSVVNTLEGGSYVFVIDADGTKQIGAPVNESYSYGRLNLSDAVMDGEQVKSSTVNAFEIEIVDLTATIKDSYGRYYGMDNSHFTSFQMYTELNEGCYWNYEFTNGCVKFTNVLNPTCIVCQSTGTEGTYYTNVAPADAPQEFRLPMLYAAVDNAVAAIEAENGVAVYYDLQGRRVANPEAGLYIRVQGSKTTKVFVR